MLTSLFIEKSEYDNVKYEINRNVLKLVGEKKEFERTGTYSFLGHLQNKMQSTVLKLGL